ncbi:flagellar protein FliT [Peribacillus huizhouensis]|uniref:Flagellar protein FliT n=1 Tax=Peribacillus huizhouensis TaxID=1501239 RepID=A0ABR6CP19_9BACI|nr:flagellar protein FliT [Peribacillus huizhouensis]MBA9026749.1 flagellar protein FliT [Peribacillus huizhouensis]
MSLQKFNDCTIELLSILNRQELEERDDTIKRIIELLDEREEWIHLINPPFTEEELQLGRQVVLLNQQVDKLLLLHKQAIQRDIRQLNEKKQTSARYSNPYDNILVDGVFYDKKN